MMLPIRTDEYSIWLESRAGSDIQQTIDDVAVRAHTPTFLPHVTLLSGLQGEEADLVKRMHLLGNAHPFPVLFSGIATGNVYHKCLYLECEYTEPLMELRIKGEKIFAQPHAYHPHLSLGYGLDPSFRDEFCRELAGKKFSFLVEEISLWHARGFVDEWRKVFSYRLT